MLLRFMGFVRGRPYSGSLPGTADDWQALESREVPMATGLYLLETFGPAFEAVAQDPTPAAVSAPMNRMAHAPTTRRR